MNTGASQGLSSPSSSSTPRVGSLSSSSTGHDSAASFTSYSSSSFDTQSPSSYTKPPSRFGDYDHYQVPYDYTRAMNATQSYAPQPHHGYMDNHHAHMSNGAMPVSIPPYQHYQGAPMQQHHHQHQQPMGAYQQPHPYQHYPYAQVVTSQPHHTQHYAQHTLPAPSLAPPPPAPPQQSSVATQSRPMDQSGQVQPPGHKPKLTGTVWEDEGTICFQVEVNGICVARREDNHFINGTKLLNVANMTRGRRDGILKSEKLRSVIKIGPMHLKGVWIPFERALEFANKEKITEQLYPLFVENIGPLLTPHMQETLRGARLQNGQQQQQQQQQQARTSTGSQASQAPSAHQHSSSGSGQPVTPSVVPTSRAAERSTNFPTPPTSNSSIMGASQNGAYNDWNTIAPASQAPLSLDTSAHGKSLPPTPTTAVSEHGMHQQYVPQYDASRPVYAAPPQQPYSAANYGHMYPVKTDMAAPARPGEEKEAEPIHYPEHGYTYNSSDPLNAEARSSPHTQGSGRATPRSVATPQSQWQSNSYTTPQGRSHQGLPSSSLTYGSSVASNGYAAPTPPTTYHYSNGTSTSIKRGRDDDDEDPYTRPMSGSDAIKRRRTMPMPGSADPSRVGPPLVQ